MPLIFKYLDYVKPNVVAKCKKKKKQQLWAYIVYCNEHIHSF